MRERGDRKAALVHVALRQHEAEVAAVTGTVARDQAMEARFRLKAQAQRGHEPLDEPRSCIVPRERVLAAGIAEADDQAQRKCHGEGSNKKTRRNAPGGPSRAGAGLLLLAFPAGASLGALFGALFRAFFRALFAAFFGPFFSARLRTLLAGFPFRRSSRFGLGRLGFRCRLR